MSEESYLPGCACDDMRNGASPERRREIYEGCAEGLCCCDDCLAQRMAMFWVLGMTEALMPNVVEIDNEGEDESFTAALDMVLDFDPRFDC
jgi:hypothetical protein